MGAVCACRSEVSDSGYLLTCRQRGALSTQRRSELADECLEACRCCATRRVSTERLRGKRQPPGGYPLPGAGLECARDGVRGRRTECRAGVHAHFGTPSLTHPCQGEVGWAEAAAAGTDADARESQRRRCGQLPRRDRWASRGADVGAWCCRYVHRADEPSPSEAEHECAAPPRLRFSLRVLRVLSGTSR